MSDKKDHKESKPEETIETPSQTAEMPGNGGQVNVELETLQSQLAEAESKASEYKDSWMRAQAEFQNYKKRVDRDNEMIYISMKGDILKKVLPVLDDLERALQNRPEDNAWASGIELIVRKLQSVLDSEGVKRIDAEGAAFDPNFHEAISHEPADGVASGHVIAVVQNGYMLGERVLRPVLVRVAQ
jgi:molecular chaperone GrpE